jgi:hypothetical protein
VAGEQAFDAENRGVEIVRTKEQRAAEILEAITNERARQAAKGFNAAVDAAYGPADWHAMITDYAGWARRMHCMGSIDKALNRYVQTAALCVAAAEQLLAQRDRGAAQGVAREVPKTGFYVVELVRGSREAPLVVHAATDADEARGWCSLGNSSDGAHLTTRYAVLVKPTGELLNTGAAHVIALQDPSHPLWADASTDVPTFAV